MSRRARPAVAVPSTGSALDPRSTEEVVAAVRRKLIFGLLALSAPLIALALSWVVDRSRREAVESHLPQGVSLATPLADADGPAATVGDRLAELGAELRGESLVDADGKPIVFQHPEDPPPDDPGAVRVVELPAAALAE